jgi:hypothetical protein
MSHGCLPDHRYESAAQIPLEITRTTAIFVKEWSTSGSMTEIEPGAESEIVFICNQLFFHRRFHI